MFLVGSSYYFFIFLYKRPQTTDQCLPLFNKFRPFPPNFRPSTSCSYGALV